MGIRVSRRTLIAAIVGAGLLLTGVASLTSGAATNTYIASGDSFTTSKYLNGTRGSSKELRTDSASNNKRYAYVKFVVPAQSGAVTNATLKLNVKNPKPDRFTVYRTTDFNEATLTFKNAPARGAQVAQVTPAGKGAISINVTSAVVANSTVSFTIASAGRTTNFSSREAGNNVAPSLTVTTAATASTVTTVRATTTTTRATTTTMRPSTTTTTMRPSTTTTTTRPSIPNNLPNPGTWSNVTNNLAGISSECGNLTMLAQVPGTDKIIAGVSQRALYMTSDNGASWTKLGSLNNRPHQILFDPANANIFYVAGYYGNAFKTTDGGMTFQQLGNVGNAQEYGWKGTEAIAVDFSDPARRTLLATIHEVGQSVWKSTDGGATWSKLGTQPAATTFSSGVHIFDSNTYLAAAYNLGWGSGSSGIFRTTNGGASWTQVSSTAGAGAPVFAPDSTMYWNSGNGIVRSTDRGQTWTSVGSNLGIAGGREPLVLSDGKVIAMTGSRLLVSSDRGNTFTAFGANLPASDLKGVVYSPGRSALFSWRNDCNTSVPGNAIQRLQ